MNNSGQTVASLVNFYKVNLDKLWIIHDDLDIPLGKFKIQKNASSAGHKGVQSVIDSLGSQDFQRLRIGIKKETQSKIPAEAFVLQKFTPEEKIKIKKTAREALDVLQKLILG